MKQPVKHRAVPRQSKVPVSAYSDLTALVAGHVGEVTDDRWLYLVNKVALSDALVVR